ncbi:hypothetical protein J2Z23_003550 [Lederbergia galactosidilyticus]|uniref:hypothetical protein n=1 Tax=Lederbergia galactosidilytica TaxID=217031 RepID=UPI001AE6070E|nr:hypothetical protein [Lederbergia galactosidilytica]MBP1916568.1 hypothetical protein [Lederbergia galactosidilytica]
MNKTILNSPSIRKYLAKERKLFIAFIIIFIGCVSFATVISLDHIRTLSIRYEPIEVTATAEFQGSQIVGTRINRHFEEVRMVKVDLPDGSQGQVRSNDIKIGEQITVLKSSNNGQLFEEKPAGPGVIEWIIVMGCIIIAILMYLFFTVSWERIRAVKKAAKREAPMFELNILKEKDKLLNSNGQTYQAIVQASTLEKVPIGSQLELVIDASGVISPKLQNPVHARIGQFKSNEYSIMLAIKGVDEWYIGYGLTPAAKAKQLELSNSSQ